MAVEILLELKCVQIKIDISKTSRQLGLQTARVTDS